MSSVDNRPEVEEVLRKLPKGLRTAWEEGMEMAQQDILGGGTVLASEKHTGIYDPKYRSWDMPPELGIGLSAVDDGVATVTLVQRYIAGFDTIYQVVTYLNCRRIFHNVTVGEVLPAGTHSRIRSELVPNPTIEIEAPTNLTPAAYELRIREAEERFRALMARFQNADLGSSNRYRELTRLGAFMEQQARLLDETAAPTEPRSFPDWFALTPAEFEYAIADLCRQDGCTQVQTPGGAGDLGADVIAHTPDGRKLVIQCKQYRGKVSSPDIQKFGGTAFHVHRAEVALLVTTATVTGPAADYAKAAGIRIADAHLLAQWASGLGKPPWS
ncbi:restriction endonuclease [Streptomyces erythrochromogenes]|uniref:restriction endonuclease n=1 Tax=Streptomyces erythrochromogenes TaxID=285574 RepID=UPI0036BE64AC